VLVPQPHECLVQHREEGEPPLDGIHEHLFAAFGELVEHQEEEEEVDLLVIPARRWGGDERVQWGWGWWLWKWRNDQRRKSEVRERMGNKIKKAFLSVYFDEDETRSLTHERPNIVGIVRRGDPGLPS
jgi:hypothetical protein